MTTIEKVRIRARTLEQGKPYTVKDFLKYGSRAAVDQALTRVVREGLLSRPVRGIYVRPKINPYTGEVPPEPIEIAKTMAKEVGAEIQVQGAEAARQMGLTTQVPVRTVFYTTGPSRSFFLGKMEIILKKVSPRKLSLSGKPGIALSALWYLGKSGMTQEAIRKVQSNLSQTEFHKLTTADMPGWMHDAFIEFDRYEQA